MAGIESIIQKKFQQLKQFTAKTIGTVEDINQLPAEFLELEQRLSSTKKAYVLLLKATKDFLASGMHSDSPMLTSHVKDALQRINSKLSLNSQSGSTDDDDAVRASTAGQNAYSSASSPPPNATASGKSDQTQQQQQQHDDDHAYQQNQPYSPTPSTASLNMPDYSSTSNGSTATLHNHMAKMLGDCADCLPYSSSFGNAISAFAASNARMSSARMQMNATVQTKFVQPLRAFLEGPVRQAKAACEDAKRAKYELDALMSRAKKAGPEEQSTLQPKIQAAQDVFSRAIDRAVSVMKRCVDGADARMALDEFIRAQKVYYASCVEALNSGRSF